MSSSVSVERFVPPAASLSSDAPGYSATTTTTDTEDGPICWKCRGQSRHPRPNGCTVCKGAGRLPARRVAARAGKITRGRQGQQFSSSKDDDLLLVCCLPDPAGYQQHPAAGALVQRATQLRVDVEMTTTDDDTAIPCWLPRESEELCNLVGHWRILQKVRSHRWTTDDLVTAAVAARELLCISKEQQQQQSPLNYCDLGTGNASVLQMVLHQAAWHQVAIARAVGVEARSEAVGLARRSLAFNVGNDNNNNNVCIHHADFRTYESAERYDLITGTPPYFRVDFAVDQTKDPGAGSATTTTATTPVVQSATIRQGGMPSAIQSAPARCEFRGGMEAYCEAAVRLLEPSHGTFVVCENYQNHERALAAFRNFGLQLQRLVLVQGRVGKGTLFGVYVLQINNDPSSVRTAPQVTNIAVRDESGAWTEDYKRQILNFMGIPS